MITLDKLLKQAGDLPSLPEAYIRVTELLDDEQSSAYQIGDAVQTDPALNGRILKLINSAYFGLRNPVTSISQAVTLLGRDDFPLRDFWQHCIKTAIIARQLAMQNARIIDHEAFFTAGLLHDIGWLVIAKVNPGAYRVVNDIAREASRDTVEVEREKLGVTHVDVGVALLEHWGIPRLIVECVGNHHESEHGEPFEIETSIVFLANRLSRMPPLEEAPEMAEILSQIPQWQQTRCTEEQIGIACRLAEEQWLEVMESLGMLDLEIDDGIEHSYRFDTGIA